MRAFRTIHILLLLTALGMTGVQAEEPESKTASAQEPTNPAAALEGFWPSERQMELLLLRWADMGTNKYDLDEQQMKQMRENVLERWPRFFAEHREQIQPVLNEWIEMRIGMEPPPQERVQAWSAQAEPIFEEFATEFDEGAREFREVLKPMQRAKFELEMLQFGVGMQVARAKLTQWKEGKYEEEEFWEMPPSEFRRRRAARQAQRVEGAAPKAVRDDQIGRELGRWDRFVAEFIDAYALDESQQTTANSLLNELKERAIAHRDRNRDRIFKLEERIAAGKEGEDELAEIKRQLVELYGPIDDMFTELKNRLEALPTTEQRARVGEAEVERAQQREAERAEQRAEEVRQREEAERKRAEAASKRTEQTPQEPNPDSPDDRP